MRGFAHCAAVGTLMAGLAGIGTVEGQTKDAASVLAAARKALGGEQKLAAVKSFTATGRTRQVRGENLVPIEFEIFVELPDKYLRKDEIPAQESGPTASGFTGDELLQDPLPAAPLPDPARKARVATLKQDFARMALGMFAGSYPAYPLTFTYVGQAEAPQGKADVLDAKGPDNITLRYFINSDTHLPIMVSWQPPAPARGAGPGGMPPRAGGPGPGGMPPRAGGPGPGGAPPAGAPPAGAPPAGAPPAGAAPAGAPPAGGPPAGAAPPAGTTPRPAGPPPAAPAGATPPPGATPPAGGAPGAMPPAGGPGGAAPPPRPEFRVYFADYRDVDGLQLPFRLRRATGADTTEETTFDRYRLNAKIDAKKFEIRK